MLLPLLILLNPNLFKYKVFLEENIKFLFELSIVIESKSNDFNFKHILFSFILKLKMLFIIFNCESNLFTNNDIKENIVYSNSIHPPTFDNISVNLI